MPTSPLITVMVNAVRKATRGLARDFGEVENLQVSKKGPADFVTRADRKVEKILFEELQKARPRFGFKMEEGGDRAGIDPDSRWIIDPIDGTTNFIHGIPAFATSVGLEQRGEIVAGVIYNPASNELFTAEKGRGAYLDGRRIRVSGRTSLDNAVIACGLPHTGRTDLGQFRTELACLQDKVAGLRRFGAASLDLAWVAAGRFDGFWERGLSAWDIAAGIIMIKEAGGIIGPLDGHGNILKSGDILAGNPDIYRAMEKALRGAR
ncbi:MAG TPA: inositol monophosphatase [Rhizobiales bacterium]|nr:inositol monophosphatase [Hyphomicrobiales bacterium]